MARPNSGPHLSSFAFASPSISLTSSLISSSDLAFVDRYAVVDTVARRVGGGPVVGDLVRHGEPTAEEPDDN
jgi:hypothetical protein